jgi:hypothetical protein
LATDGGTIMVSSPVIGGGNAIIAGGTIEFTGAADNNVSFSGSNAGMLALDQSLHLVRVDALASAGTQPILLGALKEFDGPLDQPPAATGAPLLDTVTAPFCAIGYLREKCLELRVPDGIPAKAQSSFKNRCHFVAIWQENPQLYPLTFADGSLPTMFSILWDEISLLAKDIAVVSVFGSPLESAIQRDIQRLQVQYAHHPKLEECCNNLVN